MCFRIVVLYLKRRNKKTLTRKAPVQDFGSFSRSLS